MKTPAGLQHLIDDGVIDEVILSLKSGKEATVYVVRSGAQLRCAKVYRNMAQRSFQKRAQYQEGRKVRGSRQARAISKSTTFGRAEQEAAWKNAEVDALYQLVAAGVRVPKPHGYFDGVLIMDLVTDADGHPAPRLGEVDLSADAAREYHGVLVRQVVRMLCIGLIHGDLSEFNVLVTPDGPVIIDLPQAVNAAGNNAAFAMLERDVNNLKVHARSLCAGVARHGVRAGKCGRCSSRASCGPTASSPAYSHSKRPSSIRTASCSSSTTRARKKSSADFGLPASRQLKLRSTTSRRLIRTFVTLRKRRSSSTPSSSS